MDRTGQKVWQMAGKEIRDFSSSQILVLSCPNHSAIYLCFQQFLARRENHGVASPNNLRHNGSKQNNPCCTRRVPRHHDAEQNAHQHSGGIKYPILPFPGGILCGCLKGFHKYFWRPLKSVCEIVPVKLHLGYFGPPESALRCCQRPSTLEAH